MSITVDAGLQFDPGYALRADTLEGYYLIGTQDFPLRFGTYPTSDNPADFHALALDADDDPRTRYPRVRVPKSDTGRSIRVHLLDGAADVDLTGYTLKVYSKKQSDDTWIRNGLDITAMLMDVKTGWLEWALGSTDTTDAAYWWLEATAGSTLRRWPTRGYLYLDIRDKATEIQSISTGAVPDLYLTAADVGKTIDFDFYSTPGLTGALDLQGATVKIKGYNVTAQNTPGFSASSLTGLTSGGRGQYTIASGDIADAGTVPVYFEVTRNAKVIRAPVDGAVIVNVGSK